MPSITRPELYSGDRVRITFGPYEGADAYVQHVRWVEQHDEYIVDVKLKVSWADDPIDMPLPVAWVQLL